MKRTWLLVILFALLGAAALYTLRVKKNQSGSQNSWDMDFAVPETDEITKIFIADRNNQTATLERKGDHWMYNGKYRARQTAVQTLLETIRQVRVYFIPPKASEDIMIKSLASEGIKVMIYGKNQKVLKSYYVGGVTADERGTYMIMEGAEQPYVTHLPGMIGQLNVRFMLGDDLWRDRSVFSEKPEEIESVSVEYPQMKSESFRLEKEKEATYVVKPFYSTTPVIKKPQRKGVPEAYLLQFESMVAEAYETGNPDRDSITTLVPFAIVTLKKSDGEEKKVRFWPMEVEHRTDNGQAYVFRYYADCSWDAFLLTQERVVGPIFRGYGFFFEGTPEPTLRN